MLHETRRMPAPQSVRELDVRAEALCGHRVGKLAALLGLEVPESSVRAKGFVGQLIERALGADPRAFDRPDFPDLGVELKTIPVDGRGCPVEATFCCSVRMQQAAEELWETSRLRRRLQCVLWVAVDAARSAPLAERRILSRHLWIPSASEWAILRADWEDLMGAIGAGRGETLSARDGRWLQVRPKAAHSRVRTLAPSESGVAPTLPLGFYLRTCCTERILRGEAQQAVDLAVS